MLRTAPPGTGAVVPGRERRLPLGAAIKESPVAEKYGAPLEKVGQLRPSVVEALRPLWITTAEELVSTAYEDKGRQGLAALLGMAPSDVEAMAQALLPGLPAEIRQQIPLPRRAYGLGALDRFERARPRGFASPLSLPQALPQRVSLIERMPAVRNQGERGTCVAHACTAVREFLTGDAGIDLSEQFLYWAARKKLITPILKHRDGLLLVYGMSALQESGVCPEADWPYNPHLTPGDAVQGEPPPAAVQKARAYRIERYVFLWPRDIRGLKAHLAGGYAVALTLPTYGYWGGVMCRWAGAIRMPLGPEGTRSPIARLETAHAICLSGYQDDATVPGGGYFIVRNSWGADWAARCPDRPGYCWLPYDYVRRYGLTAFTAV